MGLQRDGSLEAAPGLGLAVLVVEDGAQVAVGVGELRIRLEGARIGLDRVRVGRPLRVQLAAALEPVRRLLTDLLAAQDFVRPRARGEPCHRGARLRARPQIEHELTVRLHQATLVTHDHAAGALVPDTQGAERALHVRHALAQRLDAAANPAQRHALLQQRDERPHGDQVAELEAHASQAAATRLQ
jgi:hypothetical protein